MYEVACLCLMASVGSQAAQPHLEDGSLPSKMDSQSPQPHLPDSSAYRQNGPT